MDEDVLRYLRQVVLKAMDHIRSRMRGSDRLLLREVVEETSQRKDITNPTKAVDREAEVIVINALLKKLPKTGTIDHLAVFSEECGIATFPGDMDASEANWIAFIDAVDGTEFVESLQGGWCLLALYNRALNRVEAAVAGDMFLNRLYWASHNGPAEGLDFVTHSWFKLDGGPNIRHELAGARVNFYSTKIDRFRVIAEQSRLLDEIKKNDGRINLAWGSSMIVQVAAGYADAAVEFQKGFATYDILPGLFIGERAGLTILDMNGEPVSSRLDIDSIFDAWKRDPKKPSRIKFVAAKSPVLAHQIIGLLSQ